MKRSVISEKKKKIISKVIRERRQVTDIEHKIQKVEIWIRRIRALYWRLRRMKDGTSEFRTGHRTDYRKSKGHLPTRWRKELSTKVEIM